jgi:hypothetical protein
MVICTPIHESFIKHQTAIYYGEEMAAATLPRPNERAHLADVIKDIIVVINSDGTLTFRAGIKCFLICAIMIHL